MVRVRLKELLAERGISAYRLAKDAGLSQPTVYGLVNRGRFTRIEAETIDAICRVLQIEPGELFVRPK